MGLDPARDVHRRTSLNTQIGSSARSEPSRPSCLRSNTCGDLPAGRSQLPCDRDGLSPRPTRPFGQTTNGSKNSFPRTSEARTAVVDVAETGPTALRTRAAEKALGASHSLPARTRSKDKTTTARTSTRDYALSVTTATTTTSARPARNGDTGPTSAETAPRASPKDEERETSMTAPATPGLRNQPPHRGKTIRDSTDPRHRHRG